MFNRLIARIGFLPRPGDDVSIFVLAPFGASLALILAAFAALFFAFGFWWPYWRVGDMDIWMVYQAFLLNDGLAQEYFDHPGYLSIISLQYWLAMLKSVGLIAVDRLSLLPPAAEIAASQSAWMKATQAARLLSLVYACLFIAVFGLLLRRLLHDWRIAVLAAFVLAFSSGVLMEGRIVRTELIPAAFAYAALLLCLIAGDLRRPVRLAAIALASLLATLALVNKVQFLFLLLTFAPIVYFCAPSRPAATDKDDMPLPICALLCAAALALIYFAWPLISAGFADPAASARRAATFATRFPLYQAFAVLWLLCWTVALGIKWRSRPRAIVSAVACIAGGVSLGLLSLSGAAPGNITVVFNPLEQMLGFIPHAETPGAPPPSFLRLMLDGAMLLLARLTFVLSTSARSTVFLGWLILAGIVYAWRHGARAVAAQAALMFVAVCAVDFVGAFRGLKLEYFIITDPLLILAAAWLLAKAPSLQRHRLVRPVGVLLFGAMIAVGVAEPVKHSFKRDVPLDFCRPNYHYTSRIESFSFCPR